MVESKEINYSNLVNTTIFRGKLKVAMISVITTIFWEINSYWVFYKSPNMPKEAKNIVLWVTSISVIAVLVGIFISIVTNQYRYLVKEGRIWIVGILVSFCIGLVLSGFDIITSGFCGESNALIELFINGNYLLSSSLIWATGGAFVAYFSIVKN